MPNQHIDSSSLSHHAKNRKAYQGSLQVSSTSRYGVRAWLSHLCGCCSILVAKERKVLRALFLIAFLFFCIALASAYHRPIVEEGRIKKWNFLMILHSPALLLTADVEDGRLEIGFIVS
mgnify:CR=1 FL=1